MYSGKRQTVVLYEYVREVESIISVKGVLTELKASTSGYYDWKRKPSQQEIKQSKIKEKIFETHEESYQIYGAPKITKVLQKTGHCISQRIVSKYMNEEGIKLTTEIFIQRQRETVISQITKKCFKTRFQSLKAKYGLV